MENVFEISSALDAGFHIDWQSLPANEFAGVTLFRLERERYRADEMSRRSNDL
jgi:hypothetical protein